MKTTALILLTCALMCCAAAQDFFRPLPDLKVGAQLTPQTVPNADGIIIIKEQSLNVHRTEVDYHFRELVGLAMTRSTAIIAKVFNEAGVRRLGSFEFEYWERFGDEIPSGFMARARVQKPDGTVFTMPESDVSLIVSHKDNSGYPLARKALFKVPNLMPGDVVQIEYVLTEPFVRTNNGIFYYQDRMPVLFSNLAITCQARDEVQVFSFPADRVGEPKISQVATGLGSGDTRFWSVKNLSAIPDEPHAPPFEDLSVMTAFVAREMFYEKTDWNGLATEFWKSYLDKGSIKKSRVEELGFFPTKAPVKLDRVDSLYTALRKAIVLKPVNEVYPLVDELNDVFEKKSGDASDLAAIFYKILQDWDVDASGVWLRDRREGTFESSAPMVRWFDRIGVLVKIGETEKLYDFDRAIASSFSTPWFLKGITALVIGKSGCRSITTPASKPGETWIREAHELKFGDRFAIRDSMVTSGLGGPVEEWRHDGYELKGTELQSYLQRVASAKCIEGAAEICHSQLLDEREVTVAITGSSKSAVTVIDNFVSVRPANNLLKALYEELYAPVRTNAVVLEEPYTMTVEWMIHHPSGYVLAETPKDTTLEGFSGAQGSMACERVGDDAHLTAKLDLKTQVVPVSDYSNLIRVLNGLQRASERAVTFKKK